MCGFFLFLEWLYPASIVGDTSFLNVFIIYAVFCFLITLFQINSLLSFALKGLGLLYVVNMLFYEETFLSKSWFQAIFTETMFNIENIFAYNWYDLTPLFRTILFLIVIWLMSYLIHYWFIVVKRNLLFIVLTFIYIALIDTFTVYDAGWSIIRIFIISFIALGMANLFKEISRESLSFTWLKKKPIWFISLIMVVLFSSVIGYATPEYRPQWSDPVPFMQGVAGNYNQSGDVVRKIGYGEDDTQLGGSFVQDYTPVFKVAADKKHYWRIETKDVYTGKGWVASNKVSYDEQSGGAINLQTYTNNVETKRRMASVTYDDHVEMEKVIYPYGIKSMNTADNITFALGTPTEAIQASVDGKVLNTLPDVTMTYEDPIFDIALLREAVGDDPDHIHQQYTQLPEDLPDRVQSLAEDITADDDNRYDQAKSIEQYFGQAGFIYQISDVPVPEADEDYVDQFLFDTQAGYCDNYSTSMIVMLRSLNIPARWVKGFTGGERINDNREDGEKNVYEITNSNAHSWVEVYFPNIGWVPFEPTQGFSHAVDFADSEASAEEAMAESPEEDMPDVEQSEQQRTETEDLDEAVEDSTDEHASFNISGWHVTGLALIILIVGFFIYKTRFRWQTQFLLARLKTKHDDPKVYQDAYHHLLNVLRVQGLPIQPEQTLREYAQRIDDRYETNEMGQLTEQYEQMIYNNGEQPENMKDLYTIWHNLFMRVMA